MSARPTACAATSSTSTSAGRRDSPPRAPCCASAGCASSSISSRTTSRQTIPGLAIIPNTSFRGAPTTARNDPASFIEVGGQGVCLRPRSVFPGVARCASAQRLPPGLRQAGDRDHRGHRRTVRRHPLRHGDARAQRHLRAHMGRARRGEARRRVLADGDPGDQERGIRTSGSSPRPIGTSSGSCSSRDLTTATTRSSTTAWSTGDAESVRQHLLADPTYQEGMVRFIENHDEPRAAAAFPDGKGRAAAVAILTLPGARLLHEGQFEG